MSAAAAAATLVLFSIFLWRVRAQVSRHDGACGGVDRLGSGGDRGVGCLLGGVPRPGVYVYMATPCALRWSLAWMGSSQ